MLKQTAKNVIKIERDALSGLLKRIDSEFEKACQLVLKSKGRVVLTGMGKPGFIAQKISATLSSTGTASLFLHPAEALHGDMGRVTKEDIVIALSNSGQTEEIVKLLPLIKKIGCKIIAFTGNLGSPLAKHADAVINVSVRKEACSLNLAPTASTTAMLAMGDALAVALHFKKGFKAEDFAFYHPGGNIGRRLLKVSDIMRPLKNVPVVPEAMPLHKVLLRITKSRTGSAVIVNKAGKLTGIFTDGDLRRQLGKGESILSRAVSKLMTRKPVTIRPDKLAAEAFDVLHSRKIDEMPVIDAQGRPVGLLDVQDLLRAGL